MSSHDDHAPVPSGLPGETPTTPSHAYLDQLDEQRAIAMQRSRHPGSDFTGAPEELHDELAALVDEMAAEVAAFSDDLYEHPEVAFEEERSAAQIAVLLERHGVTVQVGVHGLDTALRAEIGAGTSGRTTAILAEYDALPGIGHGCGHNIIAAMGVGGFLALAELEKRHPGTIPGTVVLLGTPAEEGHTGKEHMARHGAFDGVDAAMMAHGYPTYDVADVIWLGRRTLTVTYHGVTAHASAQPFMGRNALDAANLLYQGLGLIRQQTPPSDRIHAVIREGGERPSIIPDRAEVAMYVRSQRPETLRDLSQRVEDAARGAAMMAGVGVTLEWDEHPPSLPVRTNNALTGRWVEAQRRRGRDPLPLGVLHESVAASTDFGNVSFRLPGMHPVIRMSGPDAALHSREFAAASITEEGHAAGADGAYGLAATALDHQLDDALADAVAREFAEAGGAIDVPHYFD